MPTRVLLRSYGDPFRPPNPVQAVGENTIVGNTGNLLFGQASAMALDVEGVELTCWTDAQLARRAAQVGERFDHVVLPLANAFRPEFADRLAALTRLVRAVDVPVTVLGVGAQSDLDGTLGATPEVDARAKDFVAAVLDRSPSIGVRGAFTADYLRSLGFDQVRVIGCPSMFRPGHRVTGPGAVAAPTADDAVALTLTPGVPLPAGWVERLVADHPRLTYVAQGLSEVQVVLWGERFPGPSDPAFPTSPEHPLLARRTTRAYLDPAAWIRELDGTALCLGTRIHGAIAAVLGGAPSHLLAHDSRTRELAEHFAIPWSRIDRLPAEPDLAALVEASDFDAPARVHPERLATYTDFLDEHGLPHAWRPGSASRFAEHARPGVPWLEVSGGRLVQADQRVAWLAEQQAGEIARLQRRQDRLERRVQRLQQRSRRQRRGRRPGPAQG